MRIGQVSKKAMWISIVVIGLCGIIRLTLNKCQLYRYEIEPVYENLITRYYYFPAVPALKMDSLATKVLISCIPAKRSGLGDVIDYDEFMESLNYAEPLLSPNDTIQLISWYDNNSRDNVLKVIMSKKLKGKNLIQAPLNMNGMRL